MSALIGLQCHLCQDHVSRRGALRLRPVSRPARAGVRLRRDPPDARGRSSARPKNLWRYRELLPITGEPRTGLQFGLHAARALRRAWPNGSASASSTSRTTRSTIRRCPTRIASSRWRRRARSSSGSTCWRARPRATSPTASRRTRRGSASSAACSSRTTSKRGRSSARRSIDPTILAIAGNYDDVNRLCTQVADRYGWGFVNINLRAYYAEGAKTYGLRDRRAARLAVSDARRLAGRRRHAAAAHRPRVPRAARGRPGRRRPAARARGAGGRLRAGRPRARSGPRASRAGAGRTRSPSRSRSATRPTAIRCRRRVRATGGTGAAVSDEQIVDAIQLLAETEGIFTEPAGGTTLAGDDRSRSSAA